MYYYFYRITNNINGKYYLGVRHSVSSPEKDTYMGSGTLIQRAISKYGKENFTKTIEKQFSSMEEAYFYEKESITLEVLLDSKCYNLKLGGQGGFEGSVYVNKDGQNRRIPKDLVDKFLLEGWSKGSVRSDTFLKKAGKHVLGTITITDGESERRISRGDLESFEKQGWYRGFCKKHIKKFREKTIVTDGIEEKIIPSSEIVNYPGFQKGNCQEHRRKNSESHSGKYIITDGKTHKRIQPSELPFWEQQGWHRGLSEENRLKKAAALKGKKFTEEHLKNLRKPKKLKNS